MKKNIALLVLIVISVSGSLILLAHFIGNKNGRAVDTSQNKVASQDIKAGADVAKAEVGFYTVDLQLHETDGSDSWGENAESMDITGDGVEDTVYFEGYKDSENMALEHFKIHVNDIEIAFDNEVDCEDPELLSEYNVKAVHSSQGNFLFVERYFFDYCTTIYDIDNEGNEIQYLSACRVLNIADGEADLEYRVDILGTWYPTRRETYSKDGFTPIENAFVYNEKGKEVSYIQKNQIKSEWVKGLKLKRKFQFTDAEGNPGELEKGDMVCLRKLDGTTFEFVNGDGSVRGFFNVEEKDGEEGLYKYAVNGVSEEKVFDVQYCQ